MHVVFFNFYHNGDLHASRGLVRATMKKLGSEHTFSYWHRNDPSLLLDIEGLQHATLIGNDRFTGLNEHSNNIRSGIPNETETVYINTWYNNQHGKYMNRYGITFDSLYASFDDSCKQLFGFSLNDISSDVRDFFPTIDYSKFDIGATQEWLRSNPGTKILIENGNALSNQSYNFDFTPIIADLAKKYPDKLFILSKRENIQLRNVFYTGDITRKNGCDLNEISYLGTFCDTIIGKASGVFTFTLTRQNLFERDVKYICLTNLVTSSGKYWIGDQLKNRVSYKSKFVVANEFDRNRVYSLIDREISCV